MATKNRTRCGKGDIACPTPEKLAYRSEQFAQDQLDIYKAQGRDSISWYACCGGAFHLTSMTIAEQEAAGFKTFS
jgi:hypothetical protein